MAQFTPFQELLKRNLKKMNNEVLQLKIVVFDDNVSKKKKKISGVVIVDTDDVNRQIDSF